MAASLTQGVSATYTHNAFHQRVKKTVGSTATLFAYDDEGNLAGEYSAAGAAIQEHVYLNGQPVAVVANGQTYAVHTDYLGAPRSVTLGSTLVWKWENLDPFGKNPPSIQTLVYNLRFPGQYYDAESGLHYNNHRTYDPELGRYVQSDPLGVNAGPDTVAYAGNSPLNFTDSSGLVKDPMPKLSILGNPVFSFVDSHPGAPNVRYQFMKLNAQTESGTTVDVEIIYNIRANLGHESDLKNFNFISNCHGTTFFQGRGWIEPWEVGNVLSGDGYREISSKDVKPGDVVTFKNTNYQNLESIKRTKGALNTASRMAEFLLSFWPKWYDHSVTVVETPKGGTGLWVYGKGGVEPAARSMPINEAWSSGSNIKYWRKGK